MFNFKKFLFLFSFYVLSLPLWSQQTIQLSLEQARVYAQQHNYDLRNASLDIESAEYKVKETVATGLPQASASIGYNDNIGLPVQLVPGDFFGQPGQDIEVQFGTRFSGSLGATVNQLLFSGSYLVGLQASKAYLEQSKKSYVKTKTEVNKSVSEAYFLVLASQEGISVIDSTLKITSKLAEQTRIIVENGFAEETEFDQLHLLLADLEVSRTNILSQIESTTAMLKYQLGMNDKDQIQLTETLVSLTEKLAAEQLLGKQFKINSNIDFQILKNQQDLALLQVKLEQSAFLPTVSAFLNYQTQAQRNEWDFFNSKGKWYASSVWGISMQIPILSSGERMHKVKQAKFQFEKTKVAEEMVSTSLNLKHKTTKDELTNALSTFQNTRSNKDLAEKIFRRTGIKYTEGLAGSLDLLNTHNQYITAESQFINAALNLLNKSVAMETLLTESE
jgi:outer membrane protein TolC